MRFVLIISFLLTSIFIFAGKPQSDSVNYELTNLISERNLDALELRLKSFEENEEFKRYSKNGSSPYLPPYLLLNAVKANDIEVVELLLRYKYPTFIESRMDDNSAYDDLALDHIGVAIFYNNLEMIKLLLKYDIGIDNLNIEVIYKADIEILKFFLDNGFDLGSIITYNGKNKRTTALDTALKHNRVDIAKFLLENNWFIQEVIYFDDPSFMGGYLGVDPLPMFIIDRYPEYNELLTSYGVRRPTYNELTLYDTFIITNDSELGKKGDLVKRLIPVSHFIEEPFTTYSFVMNEKNELGLIEYYSIEQF